MQIRDIIHRADLRMIASAANAPYWNCLLNGPRGTVQVFFAKETPGEPSLEDVLHKLATDAAGVEGLPFHEWCDLSDRRHTPQAQNAYRLLSQQTAQLKKMLGYQTYETLLWRLENA